MARPLSDEEFQEFAREIAHRFDTFQCDKCAASIARRIGRDSRATFERLRTIDTSDVIALVTEGIQISTNRIHVGVRIEDRVFDNIYPDGVMEAEWASRFMAATETPLEQTSRPIGQFFGKRAFLTRNFMRWLYAS